MTSKGNIVYIMNSFPKPILENLYSRVQNIGLIAENGAYVSLNGVWYNIVDQVDWRNDVAKILEDKVERLPGSYYKINESMIKFHTENAEDQDRVASVIGDAITHINTVFDHRGIHAYVYKNVVSVQQVGLLLISSSISFSDSIILLQIHWIRVPAKSQIFRHHLNKILQIKNNNLRPLPLCR
ncbi:Trehalose-6-P synthase/phosphatase complex subunit [Fusarium falciforme]|nr:Trehalose-6-P synthase/phosphatase complex subunit [Fusarium falciforme]